MLDLLFFLMLKITIVTITGTICFEIRNVYPRKHLINIYLVECMNWPIRTAQHSLQEKITLLNLRGQQTCKILKKASFHISQKPNARPSAIKPCKFACLQFGRRQHPCDTEDSDTALSLGHCPALTRRPWLSWPCHSSWPRSPWESSAKDKGLRSTRLVEINN